MIDAFRPGHFGNVNKSFDSFFQLGERAVIGDADNRSLDFCANGILFGNRFPRAGLLLLQTERNLFLFAVDGQDLDLDLVVNFEHFRRMVNASPRHVCNVEQTVDAAQVDKGAEIGDVLDRTHAKLTFLQFGEQPLFLFFAFFFNQSAAGDNDVAARFVNFQNDAFNWLADEISNVAGATDVNLGGWQKDVDANIDQQTTLDFAGNFAFDDVALVNLLHDVFPSFDLFSLALGEHDHVAALLRFFGFFIFFDERFNDLTDLRFFFIFAPFVAFDCAFAL